MSEFKSLRIAGVIRESITDGPGIRFVLFLQGCPHGCKGCHNPETHDFNGGYVIDGEKVLAEIRSNPLIYGVTLSGGEPVCQADGLVPLAEAVKDMGLDLGMYTGYTFEELEGLRGRDVSLDRLIKLLDFIVDGPYVEAERDLTLQFRGSRNQRFITLKDGRRTEI